LIDFDDPTIVPTAAEIEAERVETAEDRDRRAEGPFTYLSEESTPFRISVDAADVGHLGQYPWPGFPLDGPWSLLSHSFVRQARRGRSDGSGLVVAVCAACRRPDERVRGCRNGRVCLACSRCGRLTTGQLLGDEPADETGPPTASDEMRDQAAGGQPIRSRIDGPS
jgi:hypothetical protein